jgi:hypothetical protein
MAWAEIEVLADALTPRNGYPGEKERKVNLVVVLRFLILPIFYPDNS